MVTESRRGNDPRHFIYPLNPKSDPGYTFDGPDGRPVPTSYEEFQRTVDYSGGDEWSLVNGFHKIGGGDMVWAYFAKPKGAILAVGRVRASPHPNKEWGRKAIWIDWDEALTARLAGDPIPYEDFKQKVQSAVNEANPHTLKVLNRWLARHRAPALRARDRTVKFVLREVEVRLGQREFRLDLMRAYDNRCAITSCDVESVLQAAHIQPVATRGDHSTRNGLLLRADLHNLFDRGLITITDEFKVCVNSDLRTSDYKELHGRRLRIPSAVRDRPLLTAVRAHRKLHAK